MTATTGGPPGGVYAAALMPLAGDLSPDPKALIRHYRWLLANGCDGLAVLGTTGEANSFSVEERLGVIDAVAAAGLPMDRMIIGTGCCAIPDSVRLSRRALESGAGGVLVLPQFYYKKVSADGLFAAYRAIIEGVASPKLRLYIYHFPLMTGLDISLDLIERLIRAFPSTVVGIKDSSGNWPNMEAMCRRFPGFQVFAGTERYLLAALRAGGVGCISATTNVTAPLAAQVYANWHRAQADSIQERLSAVRAIFEGYPAIAALKRVLARHSGDSGWLNIRPPLSALGEEEARELYAKLDAAAFALAKAA